MLAVAGILAQEILKPGVFFYNAGLPENLPGINFGGPDGGVSPPNDLLFMGLSVSQSTMLRIWKDL